MLLEKIAAKISRISSIENDISKGILTSFKNSFDEMGGEWIISDRGKEYVISIKKMTKTSLVLEAVEADNENNTQDYEVSFPIVKKI